MCPELSITLLLLLPFKNFTFINFLNFFYYLNDTMFKKYTVVSPLHTVRRFSSSEAAHVSLDILPESQCKTQHLRLDFLNFFFCFLYVCTYIYDKRTVLSLTPPHFVTYGPFGTHGRQNTSVHVRACPDLPSLPGRPRNSVSPVRGICVVLTIAGRVFA